MPLSRGRYQEIKILLENVKNLEVYPDINKIEKNEEKKELTMFDLASETKKVHLFYIQPILNDFINTKDQNIKNLVKDIFQDITTIIGIPNLTSKNS